MGISSVHFMQNVLADINIINEVALSLLSINKDNFKTFKILTKRQNKSFPKTSPELNSIIGDTIRLNLNKKVKLKAASETSNISNEEPLPLNDPFVGDASISGTKSNIVLVGSEEKKDERSLYNFKLIATMSGTYESYASLVNASGEIIHLQLHEELSEGISLVSLNQAQAIFQKDETDSYLIINFNNQIKETKEIY